MKKIVVGLFIGLILNLGYFGWEFQEYIYYFFEPCQICNNKEIKDCERYYDGLEIKDCNKCINGKIGVGELVACNECNGNGGLDCFGCYGEKFIQSKIASNEDCLICNGTTKIKTDQPCLYCDGEGKTICIGCVKGCFDCRGTGEKDCFMCIKGSLDGEPCFFCNGLGYENCKKCNGTGDH